MDSDQLGQPSLHLVRRYATPSTETAIPLAISCHTHGASSPRRE